MYQYVNAEVEYIIVKQAGIVTTGEIFLAGKLASLVGIASSRESGSANENCV